MWIIYARSSNLCATVLGFELGPESRFGILFSLFKHLYSTSQFIIHFYIYRVVKSSQRPCKVNCEKFECCTGWLYLGDTLYLAILTDTPWNHWLNTIWVYFSLIYSLVRNEGDHNGGDVALLHMVIQGPLLMEVLPSSSHEFQSYSIQKHMGESGELHKLFWWDRLEVVSIPSNYIPLAKTFHGRSKQNGSLENVD